MSDSDSDARGPGITGFLFGNVDENNKLEADYLDADVVEQLKNIEGGKLGFDGGLQDLNGRSTSAKGQAQGGEVKKDKDAQDFYDEEELVDYDPKQAELEERQHRKVERRKPVSLVRPMPALPSKADLPKLELPILAVNGKEALLRFSQLFAEPLNKPVVQPRKVERQWPQDSMGEMSDEEEAVHLPISAIDLHDSDSDSASYSDSDQLNEKHPSSAEQGPEEDEVTRGIPRGQAASSSASQQTRLAVRIPSGNFDGVQLVDWEQDICWASDAEPSRVFIPEMDSDEDDSAAPRPGTGNGAMHMSEEEDAADALQAGAPETLTQQQKHTPQLQENVWLAEGGWEEDIRWGSDDDGPVSPPHLDMNDPRLIFRLLKPPQNPEIVDQAAALILPPLPKLSIASAPPQGRGKLYQLLARQNVSQDSDYAKKKTSKVQQTFKYRHAAPALQLTTLPPKYSDKWSFWHRPRGLWVPMPSKAKAKAKEGDFSTVKIMSLVGVPKHAYSRVFKEVDLANITLGVLWENMKQGVRFQDCANLSPTQLEIWYRGAQPQALPRDTPVLQTGVPHDANMELSLVVSGVHALSIEKCNSIPEALKTTPTSVAIQKPKQLTACEGHIILLEYLEELPLLLSRPGMVVRSSTYYRKQTELDTGHKALLEEEPWKTGAVESLQPDEDPPFWLGDIPPGKQQLTVECNMFRSPAVAHTVPYTDFLLVRAPSGALTVRGITGSFAVGQQQPLRRIPVPGSKECRELEENCMVAYVMRELRRQKVRNEKKAPSADAVITVRELADLFPTLSEGVIRSRLRDRCNCVPQKEDSAGTFKLADGIQIAEERELRQLVKPEEWCGHESMIMGQARLTLLGLAKQDKLASVPPERFKIAAEQLSPPEVFGAAIAELELGILTAPWTLTDNFVSVTREGRGSLALTGYGDPTSRGEGFSYLKETAKSAADKAMDATVEVPKDGNITGTNKDLRRLTMAESKAVLLKLGLEEAEIKGLTRWERIKAVRDLSTAAAGEEEGELGKIGNRYARIARASFEEQQRARRQQSAQIFNRQIAALSTTFDPEDFEDDNESWGDELEKELAEDDELTYTVQSAKKAKQVTNEEDDEIEDLEELRKSGFLDKEGSNLLGKAKPKLEAKAGAKRIKRTIKYMDADDNLQTRVIIYTDKEKIQALNDLYRKDGGGPSLGFGKRVISGGGTWTNPEEAGQPKKTKKNMSRIKCTACGQMGHYKSNKICPLYEQTYGKAAKAKKAEQEQAEEEAAKEQLKIKISVATPLKRNQSLKAQSLQSVEEDDGNPLKRMRSEMMSPTSPHKSLNPRKFLGIKVLHRALVLAKRAVPEAILTPFKYAVTKASAPDYNDFIPQSEEMHLDKIERKAKNGQYHNVQQFLEDVDKIVKNSATYNEPGKGKYGGPALVQWAQQVADEIKQQLEEPELVKLRTEIEAILSLENTEGLEAAARLQQEAPVTAGPAVQWVLCTRCEKWRKISERVFQQTVPTSAEGAWHCDWDDERPGASCDLPEDTE